MEMNYGNITTDFMMKEAVEDIEKFESKNKNKFESNSSYYLDAFAAITGMNDINQ